MTYASLDEQETVDLLELLDHTMAFLTQQSFAFADDTERERAALVGRLDKAWHLIYRRSEG